MAALAEKSITVNGLKQFVKTTNAGESIKRLWVSTGLFLEARPASQSASWVLRFAVAGRKASKGYGNFPGVGLAAARALAKADLELLNKGVNPVENKRAKLRASLTQSNRTVRAAMDEWLPISATKLTSEKYAAQRGRRLLQVLDYKPNALPSLGQSSISTTSREDVSRAIGALKSTPETARRVVRDLEKIYEWALSSGWRKEANPCTGVVGTLATAKTVGHRAPDAADLGRVVRALYELPARPGVEYDYGAALAKLLLLTGARTGEVRLAQWSEVIDLEGNEPRLEVPISRMKRRKAWVLPLSAQAVAIVRELKERADTHDVKSPLIFHRCGFTGRGSTVSENAANDTLKRAGLADVLVGHGLRKLFSTVSHASWPYSSHNRERAIEGALAHATGSAVEATYNKNLYLAERRVLAGWYGDLIERHANHTTAVVVPLKRVRKAQAA